MITEEEIKESGDNLSKNLEYILLHYPDEYNRELIDENIETLVDAYCEIGNISDSNHKLIGLIWRYAALSYTNQMIIEFFKIESLGSTPYIKPMTYKRALALARKDKCGRQKTE